MNERKKEINTAKGCFSGITLVAIVLFGWVLSIGLIRQWLGTDGFLPYVLAFLAPTGVAYAMIWISKEAGLDDYKYSLISIAALIGIVVLGWFIGHYSQDLINIDETTSFIIGGAISLGIYLLLKKVDE
jgi:hypothetical protein